MFHEQLIIDNFLPSKRPERQTQENPDQTLQWYFNNLKSSQHQYQLPASFSSSQPVCIIMVYTNYRGMTYPIFEVTFLLGKIIVERQEIAYSIRLEKLFRVRQ